MSNLYNLLKRIIEKLNATVKSVNELPQSDWNQNDETAHDYVKNRPLVATNDDILNFLVDIVAIVPITNFAGEILISPSNEIYYL